MRGTASFPLPLTLFSILRQPVASIEGQGCTERPCQDDRFHLSYLPQFSSPPSSARRISFPGAEEICSLLSRVSITFYNFRIIIDCPDAPLPSSFPKRSSICVVRRSSLRAAFLALLTHSRRPFSIFLLTEVPSLERVEHFHCVFAPRKPPLETLPPLPFLEIFQQKLYAAFLPFSLSSFFPLLLIPVILGGSLFSALY